VCNTECLLKSGYFGTDIRTINFNKRLIKGMNLFVDEKKYSRIADFM